MADKGFFYVLIVMSLATFIYAPAACGVIVYDNSATLTDPWSCISGSTGVEIGDQINLAGTSRVLTGIDIMVWTTFGGSADMQVRIYENDGVDGEPETLLWESVFLPDVQLPSGHTRINFSISNILVPDTITWVLVDDSSGHGSPTTYGPPTTGSSSPFYWVHTSGWEKRYTVGGFDLFDLGATVYAVPEPTTLLLFGLGGLVLHKRKHA